MTRRLLLLASVCFTLATPTIAAEPPKGSPSDPDSWYGMLFAETSARWLADEGRYRDALIPAAEMLRVALKRSDTLWTISAHQGIARLSILVGQPDSARRHATAALRLSGTLAGEQMRASSLWVLAEAQEALGQRDSALAGLRDAARVALAARDSLSAGVAVGRFGDRLLARGAPAEALPLLDSAVVLLAGVNEPGVQSQAHATLGRCLHRLNRYERACAEFEIAYRLLTEARTHTITDFAHIHAMERAKTDFFAEWQDSWLARGTTISFQYRALGVAERARAQALMDRVQPADTMVSDASGFLHTALATGRRFGPGRDLADDVREAIHGAVPRGAALLYYSQTPDSLIAWVWRADSLITLKLFYPARIVERLRDFYPAVYDTGMIPEKAKKKAKWWKNQSQKEREDVLRHVAEACFPDTLLTVVKGARELIVVPDGWLNRVPFNALPVGGKALGLRMAVRLAPSLALLEHIEQRPRPSLPVEPAEVMVIGDPETRDARLGPIPAARVEAANVASMFGTKPILGAAATESLVTAVWPRLRILHLATHGLGDPDPDSALRSCVFLTPTATFDGQLTAFEVQHLLPSTSIDLVFLSACQTAYGASTSADATLGLPRAFLINGTRTVIASMWNLPDESTSFLVQRFYAHLLQDPNRPTAGEALHLAMVETSKRWNDPIFWAAFQVVGGY